MEKAKVLETNALFFLEEDWLIGAGSAIMEILSVSAVGR